MNVRKAPVDQMATANGTGGSQLTARLARNILRNFATWISAVAPPPPAAMFRLSPTAVVSILVALIAVAFSMFFLDTAASDWARAQPTWFIEGFRKITNFGLSGWFLIPGGIVLVYLAAVISPVLSWRSRGVLTALAVRFGFLFLAIGVPGLFVAIIKGMIGRARPYVGGHDRPFDYVPFIWRADYASMPSGHTTTSVAAAIAIGAIWPRTRVVMWLYALVIMFSRVVVLEHHPSDVIAGALVGAAGVYVVRRWFAARHLAFGVKSLRAFPAPSWRRIKAALGEALRAA